MAELLKVREITVDTMQYKDFATKEEELKVMRFYQNDLNSAKLLINVTHDKVVTDFSTATKVQIAFLKPDGKRVFQDVQNVNQMQGKYYVVLSTQTLIAYGNVVAQLRLTFPNNKVIETCKFVFAVDESIMSDTALESTNEFPVIQKAIEVGEKFKDVDFAPIIKAGELAAGALPKAGGTMTGPIYFNNSTAKYGIHFQSGGVSKTIISGDATRINMWDNVNAMDVWSYNPATKQFDITAATNVVKKAEAYTDYWMPTGRTRTLAANTDLNTIQASGAYAGNGLLNAPNGQSGYFYIEVLQYGDVKYCKQIATDVAIANPRTYTRVKYNDVWGAWQESISSLGGTLTGNLNLDRKAAESRDITYRKDGVDQLSVGVSNSDKFRLWDNVNTLTAFEYAPLTKLFTMLSDLALPKGATVTGPLTISGTGSQLRIDDKGPSIRIDQPTDVTTSARGFQYYEGGATVAGVGRLRNGAGIDQMYMGWGTNPWSDTTSLTVSDYKFTYKGKPVAMRDKDGQFALTLTAEATNANSGYLPIADRRGNTVTVRMEVSRNAGSTNSTICTLPADLRPANTLSFNMLANDGSLVGVNFKWDGSIEVFTTGKTVKIVATFVVN
ncbi:BppU family phage baseplate upper protein [Bacillus thuringiensis]|uniref:BppU family phage baseplate upper protein n=2 Tax=Bacillus thuringiensis TaxID=1428 RepID=UPI00211D1DBE|nr:BppU family phage baseplate upper protein [Bacillus thuringiensis]